MASVFLLHEGVAELLRKIGWVAFFISFLSLCLIYYLVPYKPARFCFLFAVLLIFVISAVCLLAGYI